MWVARNPDGKYHLFDIKPEYDEIYDEGVGSDFIFVKDGKKGRVTLDKKFVSEAKAAGMINLNGHRSVGGMRASIYNAMPIEGVEALVAFMAEFEKNNG